MTSAEKAALRARAQTLAPALHVGKDGVTPTVTKELDIALRRKELVKVRFSASRAELRSQCAALAEATGAECAGGVGRVAAFFRAKPETTAAE